MKIIPAIDIINGNCVRLTKGDYATQKAYSNNPVDVAKSFEDAGLRYIHLVDLDGARSGTIVNHKVLADIAASTNLSIDFGGGIKSEADIRTAFENGANQVTAGSIAFRNPALVQQWILDFGKERIILGADCRDRKIAINGWLETSDEDVLDFISSFQKKGIVDVVCTDISKDGMLSGPSTELYREIIGKTSVNLIASGGISSLDDVWKMKEIGCTGVIIGKAIYEGTITLNELSKIC